MRLQYIFYISLVICFVFSCSDTATKNTTECSVPKPEAVFSSSPSAITSHNFELNGHNAQEDLKFADGGTLTLFQSGCEKISQEFRFTFPQSIQTDRTDLAVEKLMFLSNLDDKYMTFANWANAIKGLKSQFTQMDEVEVEQGFFVGLDKIDSANQTILVVKLFQK